MSWLGLLLHVLLVGVAALALAALTEALDAAWRGQKGPLLAQQWRDLVRLWRKSGVVPAGASLLFTGGPVLAAAAAGVAALLVPGAVLGGPLGGVADLVVVVGLLAASRLGLAAALRDAGSAALARPAAGWGHAPGVAVLMVVAMAALLLSGGTNLDAAVAAVRDGGVAAHAAGLLAGLAVLGVAAAEAGVPQDAFPGRLGAVARVAGQLRVVAWVGLAGALALPVGIAGPGAGVGTGAGMGAWVLTVLVAVGCWVGKMLLLGAVMQALRGWRPALPLAALLAVIAVALASVQGRA